MPKKMRIGTALNSFMEENKMRPSEKNPEMTAFLEKMFGRTSSIEDGLCTMCRNTATVFRDEVSRREYCISGLCQSCQDKTFGG